MPKFYAATQVIDEARHVEVFGRYLHEKLDLVYPLNNNLRSLLDDALTDSRWDMTYLAMQVLIEGLALAAFSLIRNNATDPLAKSINAYVMQDEARHVMFGRLALRDYYPQLTDAERDEREEFCVDACYRMRDRFLGEEVWERLGLPVAEVVDIVQARRAPDHVPRLPVHADRAGARATSASGVHASAARSTTWACSASPMRTSMSSSRRTRSSPNASTMSASKR